MDALRLGLILLVAAPVTWLVGVFVDGSTDYVPALLAMLLGLLLAAWAVPADRRWLGAAGFAVAALGILWFYGWDLLAHQANQVGGVFFVGCACAAVGTAAGLRRTLAAGLFVVGLAGLLWVYVDWSNDASWIWQPGNLLTAAGGAVAGWGAWKR